MSETGPNDVVRDALRDRFMERALAEQAGGEKPPNLSARILAACEAATPSEVIRGDTVMNAERNLPPWRHRRWLVVAVAASLLVAAAALLSPRLAGDRRTARRTDATEVTTAAKPETTSQLSSSAAQGDSSSLRGGERQSDYAQRTAADGAAPQESLPADRYGQQGQPVEGESLKMMVKPQIIVDGEVEGRLGEAPRGPVRPALEPAQASAPAEGRVMTDFDSSIDLIRSAAVTEHWDARRAGESTLSLGISQSQQGLQEGGVLHEGQGPGAGGDRYARIEENPFKAVSAADTANRLSTFSIDVDTASYANVRQFLMQSQTLPPADAVRIEELVNYFDYSYSPPTGDVPFASNVEVAACPWAPEHRLVRIGIKGREIGRSQRPRSNLVFLIDVSGSMDEPNKLPLLVEGMKLLTGQLGENDQVAIVVYASSEGLALESTAGSEQSKIMTALDRLAAGGSTAGGAGIQLAYKVATDNFIEGGVNRVILCTDGDFNVGVTSPAELERMAETQAKETGVFLTVLGFGRGNLNDAMMEQIADKGNGNYHYVDTRNEARKVLVEEMSGTLVTIAKDVKIQVEFNPAKVGGYRLIGYENRALAAEDFNDDAKDAGEIGAGHAVTALYEIVPAGKAVPAASIDELKYQPKADPPASTDGAGDAPAESDDLLTLKIRYKQPDGDESQLLEFPVTDEGRAFGQASEDFKFASAVASFGMLLRDSKYKGNATYAAVAEIAGSASGRDPQGYRAEFVEMVKRARELSGQ